MIINPLMYMAMDPGARAEFDAWMEAHGIIRNATQLIVIAGDTIKTYGFLLSQVTYGVLVRPDNTGPVMVDRVFDLHKPLPEGVVRALAE